MTHVNVRVEGGVAAVVLSRGKVNALDEATIDERKDRLREIEADEAVRAVVLSGEGAFFSFGFDILFGIFTEEKRQVAWFGEALHEVGEEGLSRGDRLRAGPRGGPPRGEGGEPGERLIRHPQNPRPRRLPSLPCLVALLIARILCIYFRQPGIAQYKTRRIGT